MKAGPDGRQLIGATLDNLIAVAKTVQKPSMQYSFAKLPATPATFCPRKLVKKPAQKGPTFSDG